MLKNKGFYEMERQTVNSWDLKVLFVAIFCLKCDVLLLNLLLSAVSWVSVVGIATRLGVEWSRVWIPVGARDCFFSGMSRLDLGPTKPIKWVPGFLLGLGREFYHSPSSSAKVKNEWSCTSPPPVCLQGKGQLYVMFSMPHRPQKFCCFTFTKH